MNHLFLALLLSSSFAAKASIVAVVDSGVDYKHSFLSNQMWVNQGEIADNGRDEDHNGYQDDVYGWNFAESNNLVIDYKYLGTFSEDPAKFFELQGKSFLGTITPEEKAWVNAKVQDPNFIKEMGKFGNFVHGTHVAGITKKNSPDVRVLAVKLIPTEVKLPGGQKTSLISTEMKERIVNAENDGSRMKILKQLLGQLASQQMVMMKEIGYYLSGNKADVANCSFGTGFAQAKSIVSILYKVVFFKAPTDEQVIEPTKFFMDTLVTEGQKFVGAAKNTLFVIAAGNDGANNDLEPTSPANVKADNTITVAATFDRAKLASFSNYGKEKVDIAAPGVVIESSIPGDQWLKVSGTSQASPFVANVAGQLKDVNKNLTPLAIKKILMGTVDKKEYLKSKVVAEGIVNPERAVYAAKLSLSVSVDEAISQAKISVDDVHSKVRADVDDKDGSALVLPLPSTFSF
ncbi:MAG: S8 family serine peptidase [Bacteriovoracaceae bacterium]